jgi:RNA recognition motif-containing protein
MDPSTHPASARPVTQHGDIVGRQRTLSDVHPRPHGVHSPPFAFPRHISPPIREENLHHPAYVSPSMMTVLPPHAPVYQYRTPPDLVPTSPYIFPPTVSTPTSPIYPTSPPLSHSPPTLRHSASSPLGSPHHSTPYAMHGAYTPMGPTAYAYPPPAFVPAPSPPQHSRRYTFPTGQESQGTWWYSPPGSTVAFSSFDGSQREFQPRATAGYPPVGQLDEEPPDQPNTASLPSETQQTRRLARIDRPSNDARQEAAQPGSSPTSLTSARARHQERRSYHPNPPAHRSEWAMWAGNVPSNVTQDELQEFFNRPLPPAESGTSVDRQQGVYGGVLTVFLISRSNCAFVNFGSEEQLQAATARFHGHPIHPDDQRCPRLVCRVRRREDDLMAGVGAQRGSGMHIKWVNEQNTRIQREQTDTVALPKDLVRSSSPLSVPSDDSGWIGEGHVSTHVNLSRPASIASTNSDILTRYFPQRYFILKSLTEVGYPASLKPAATSNSLRQDDLDLSAQKNIWATQRHNQEILDQAFRTSKDVFLIFSVNKSGEFYGYARLATHPRYAFLYPPDFYLFIGWQALSHGTKFACLGRLLLGLPPPFLRIVTERNERRPVSIAGGHWCGTATLHLPLR